MSTSAVAAAPTLELHPEHVADLRRSGLTDETIAAAGIRSLSPGEWGRYLSPFVAARITSAYLIPYGDDFYRAKLFPPIVLADGKRMKYYQARDSAPRLYLPPRARPALADPNVPLRWVEGEKKTLAGDQAGRVCVGLGGLWNWCVKGLPLPDLDRVDHVGRTEILVPDSDVWTRPELLRAVYALAKELEARGATVRVEKLPAGPDGTKAGLDDYLCAHAVADLDTLPRLPLKHPAFTRTAEWWKGWRAKKATLSHGATLESQPRLFEQISPCHPRHDQGDRHFR